MDYVGVLFSRGILSGVLFCRGYCPDMVCIYYIISDLSSQFSIIT